MTESFPTPTPAEPTSGSQPEQPAVPTNIKAGAAPPLTAGNPSPAPAPGPTGPAPGGNPLAGGVFHDLEPGVTSVLTARYMVPRLLSLMFAFGVFLTTWYTIGHSRREVLAFVGTMLMLTMLYLELLIVRDSLWVLQGGLISTRRWRDVFFPRQAMQQQRLRKLVVLLFALIIFSYFYYRTQGETLLLGMGIILFMTVQYFEILVLRDELTAIANAMRLLAIESGVGHPDASAAGPRSPADVAPSSPPGPPGPGGRPTPSGTPDSAPLQTLKTADVPPFASPASPAAGRPDLTAPAASSPPPPAPPPSSPPADGK